MFGARPALCFVLLVCCMYVLLASFSFIYWISLRPAPTPTPQEVATLLLSQDEVCLRCNSQCHFGRCCLPSTSGHLRPSRREKSAVSSWFPLTPGFTGFVVRAVIKKTIVSNHCIELVACASLACYEALFGWVHLPGNPHIHIYIFMMGGIFGCAESPDATKKRTTPSRATYPTRQLCTDALVRRCD